MVKKTSNDQRTHHVGAIVTGRIGKLMRKAYAFTLSWWAFCFLIIVKLHNLIRYMSKNKIIWSLFTLSFLSLVVLSILHGSFLYSKIKGTEDMYSIGKDCVEYRSSCEQKYFKNYLDKISTLEKSDRIYFENIIIEKDQEDYTGNCPCPYNSASNGSYCGGRSSYSKNGTVSYCYGSDIQNNQISYLQKDMIDDETGRLADAVQENINVFKDKTVLYLLIIIYIIIFFGIKNKLK